MDIAEVSQILGLCNFLKVPKHVFITNEAISSNEDGAVTFYRGLQPRLKKDSIFLGQHMDPSTPIHEALHTLGLGEFGADVATRLLMRKNVALRNFPEIQKRLHKKVEYVKVDSSKDYPEAHNSTFKDRVAHFVLKSAVQNGNY